MPGDFPAIAKRDLFTRLAEGHAAGITVVTPNLRLARVLRAEFDVFQINRKLTAWEDADILPFGAFVERRYEDALYSGTAAELPPLLTPAQEQAIWESILAGSELLAVSEAAAQCADAWRLAHAWRIDGALEKFPGGEDARAFAGWARGYAKRCKKEGFADSAVLPDVILKSEGKRPKLLVAYGFDILPPQHADFFKGLGIEVASCEPARREATKVKTSYSSARHELEAAAQWARTRLEAGAGRIGVVVPDLQQRRREVARVFSRTMRPGDVLPGAQRHAMPFNVSLGEPLSRYPLVRAGLLLLEFSFHELSFEKASQIIRSPFIAGAESEFAARARLDAKLRRRLPARLTLPKLIGEVRGCPVLRSSLERLFSVKKVENSPPHFWALHFTALLEAAGFPGGRALDSEEFQARAKFNEMLGEFSRLGLVCGKISVQEATRQVQRLCAQTLFQPETPEAPVQVVGILESAGLEFDRLWVSGLTEDAWPLAARPNPFLPVALQKKAGIPQASAESSLALDRRITEGWLGAAHEVVLSWPEKEEDRNLVPSPLIAQVPERMVEVPEYLSYRDVLFATRVLESFEDEKAPPINSKTVKGGSRVLADQAACPFRAFARHRLGAEGLEAPAPGLDAAHRGRLLHALMKNLWSEIKTSASLSGNLNPAIEKSAAKAVDELRIEGRFAQMERSRLRRLACEWLEVEREREPFEVLFLEQKRELQLTGLSFSGRIDRMDRLAAGGHALIDYKTGRATPNDWLGERPDEPQLPLYAVTASEDVSAVAFAKLKHGEMRFSGFSYEKKVMPQVKQAQSWQSLVEGWKKELEALARGFAAGDARVDPKRALKTCRNCDLQPLCRVYERVNALAEGEEEGE